MPKPKRALYAALGFLAWRILAVLGVRFAKNRLAERRRTSPSAS